MEETLRDIIFSLVGSSYHETHFPEGGVDFYKVEDKINNMTNVELIDLISDALREKLQPNVGTGNE